jgi:predicted DNA-binding transcriptional regulator AlpA
VPTRSRKRTNPGERNIPATLPAEGFVRQPTVLAVFAISKSTLWRWMADGRFPKPCKLGPGTTAWAVDHLRAHIDRIRATA